MLIFENTRIDLENTFSCGQNFRWKRLAAAEWAGNVDGRAVVAVQRENGFALRGATEADAAFWRHYFDLDTDYAALLTPIMDDYLQAALCDCGGIRVLNQPFFETLCCFILSANNNIGRITGIVQRLCAIAPADENGLHPFPTPEELVQVGQGYIDTIGAGYRAPYLWEAAQRMAEGYDAQRLCALPYEEACKEIRCFKGVGEKVADCVLLFSCGKREAFPVDTWVEKLLVQWYGMTGTRSALKKQAMARFGQYGGVAQQVLFFHAMRQKL